MEKNALLRHSLRNNLFFDFFVFVFVFVCLFICLNNNKKVIIICISHLFRSKLIYIWLKKQKLNYCILYFVICNNNYLKY